MIIVPFVVSALGKAEGLGSGQVTPVTQVSTENRFSYCYFYFTTFE